MNEENVKNEEIMIPVNIMCIAGNNETPVENRISYSQLTFVKPSQWQLFTMRLNDLLTTMNGINEDNRPTEPNESTET